MSNDNVPDDRDALFRSVLVRKADRSPKSIRRLSLRTIAIVAIASIVVFAVAGALTGGAVASAAAESARQATANATARFAAVEVANRIDGTVLGDRILKSATHNLTIERNVPSGANYYVFGVDCLDPGTFHVAMDHLGGGDFTCTAAQARSKEPVGKGFGSSLANPQSVYVKISSKTDARFTVWFAWIKIPTVKPSAQEKAQLSEGPVTRTEVVTALNRQGACMAKLGYPTSSTAASASALTPWVSWPSGSLARGAETRCSEIEDSAVDQKWFDEIEAGTAATASVTACLEQRGVQPAQSAVARVTQLEAIDQQFQTTCAYVG